MDYRSGATVNRIAPTVVAGRSAAAVSEGEPIIEVSIYGVQVTQVTTFDLMAARDLAKNLIDRLAEVAIELEGERRSHEIED